MWDKRSAGKRGPVFTVSRQAGAFKVGNWAGSNRFGRMRPEAEMTGKQEEELL